MVLPGVIFWKLSQFSLLAVRFKTQCCKTIAEDSVPFVERFYEKR